MDAFKNGASCEVSTGYDAAAVSVVLSAGEVSKLPAVPFNTWWFDSTLYPDAISDPHYEMVRVTAIVSNTLTITRAQESTSASTKNTSGSTYKLVAGVTAKTLNTDIPALASAAVGGLGVFGDGNDGALTFDGSSVVLGLTPSGSVYTLTRDIYPSSMTVNTGVTIKNRGFRIICKGTLTLTGTAKIHDNGNNGTNTGTKGSALAAAGVLQASSAQGGNDQVAGSSITSSLGGAGGAGGGGSGGAGGTVTAPSTNNGGTNLLRSLPFTLWIDTMIFALTLKGGAGGGGGTDGTNVGGGGGSGGGAVVVAAKTIAGAGFIQADGGNGGAGNTTNDSGGGGGGGGYIAIVTSAAVSGVTLSAAGGAGGASGGGSGVAGATGSSGNVYQVVN